MHITSSYSAQVSLVAPHSRSNTISQGITVDKGRQKRLLQE